jgi:hypothetical protein
MDDVGNGSLPPVGGPPRGADPDAKKAAGERPDRGRTDGGGPDPGKLVLAVNSVIAAVGGTYASTHSIAATMVAGGVGLACAAVLVWKR